MADLPGRGQLHDRCAETQSRAAPAGTGNHEAAGAYPRPVRPPGAEAGLGGIAGHPYAAEAEETLGHMGRVHMIQDLSAVTAACMMVKKTVFFEVGKFEPEYAVAFNDVDLCMKIRKAGYLIVYTPYARLTHYESKSRGLEDSREKVKRFDSEVALFEERWGKELEKSDPNYNPNFRLDEKDFRLNVHVRR